MIVDARDLHAKHGAETRDRMASLLASGQGVGGQALAPKRRPDGRPLGGSLPQVIASASVQADHDGYAIEMPDAVQRFHEGNPAHGQPPRPIVGITERERAEQVDEVGALAARQITARLRGGA